MVALAASLQTAKPPETRISELEWSSHRHMNELDWLLSGIIKRFNTRGALRASSGDEWEQYHNAIERFLSPCTIDPEGARECPAEFSATISRKFFRRHAHAICRMTEDARRMHDAVHSKNPHPETVEIDDGVIRLRLDRRDFDILQVIFRRYRRHCDDARILATSLSY